MRKLINYIRSCFCKHEWELIFDIDVTEYGIFSETVYNQKTYRCKKCGSIERIRGKKHRIG